MRRQVIRSLEPVSGNSGTPRSTFSCFGHDRKGSIAILFGLTLLPMVVFAGAAVDYAKATHSRTILQAAVDAAALSTSRTGAMTDSERAQRARETFLANVVGKPFVSGVVPNVTASNLSVTVNAQVNIPTSFVRVIGIDSIPVSASAKVIYRGKKIELALVTDITGSMAEVRNGAAKIDGLKLAAGDLLNIILPDNGPADAARVALVPFANYVNAGTRASDVTGLNPTKTISNVTNYLITCVTERTGGNAYTDVAPNSNYVGSISQGRSGGTDYSLNGVCNRNNSASPLPAIIPMTSDKAALLTQINSFTPGGSTAGHLGTAWGWYMLAPTWNSIWNLATPPAAYNDEKVIKAVVIMTDGLYNTQYSSSDSRTQALALCTGMKGAGLVVYTVGFGFDPNTTNSDDLAAKDTLTQCASGTGHYFFPYDGDALRSAFSQIGQQVTTAAGQAVLSN